MRNVIESVIRMSSFTGKELREVLRRPGVLASLVFGPFLIMFIFGLGYSGYRAPFATEIVVPENSDLPREPDYYGDLAPGRLDVRDVTSDADAAEQRLRDGAIDLLIVAPENASTELRSGHQTTIRVAWNQIDPVYDQLAGLATSILVSSLNAEIVETAAAEGIAFAEGELGPAADVPPEVIARPTKAETENVAPTEPNVISFFGPAVFALVLQHLAITLTALSMVRERLSGQMDRFRVAPVTSMELLVGKYVAYAVLSLAVAAIVGVLLVGVLGVPLLGGWLLASVFFSGFVRPVSDFATWTQYLAYALPVTHGIGLLQEHMLRGEVRETWMLAALAGIGLVLYVGSLMRLRRVLRRAD